MAERRQSDSRAAAERRQSDGRATTQLTEFEMDQVRAELATMMLAVTANLSNVVLAERAGNALVQLSTVLEYQNLLMDVGVVERTVALMDAYPSNASIMQSACIVVANMSLIGQNCTKWMAAGAAELVAAAMLLTPPT